MVRSTVVRRMTVREQIENSKDIQVSFVSKPALVLGMHVVVADPKDPKNKAPGGRVGG